MINSLDELIALARFRLGILTTFDIVDLLLVTAVYIVLLSLIRRSQAAALLRGVLVLILFLVAITLLFPLPTLNWLITGLILALLLAVPITLQPELRRWLEEFGRNRLLPLRRQQLATKITPPLRKVIEECAEQGMGALIVLEGQQPLDEIIETGVPVDARLSAELLNTIFFDKTPLHDGAVILREERVVAASCVLPLTQQTLLSYRRMGTRHRAAVGLSEVCDALVIVVSEETGHLSLAQGGRLQSRQDINQLQQTLAGFFARTTEQKEKKGQWRMRSIAAGAGRNLLYASFAFLLAVLTWGATIERTNPTAELTFSDVPLRLNGLPSDVEIINDVPEETSITVRTTTEIGETLNSDSFQAMADVEIGETGLLRLPVNVTTGVENVDVLVVSPAEIDLELVPIITRTFTIDVQIADQELLPSTYELTTVPTASPSEVVVRGPETVINAIRTVQANVSVADVTQTIQRVVTLEALGARDAEVAEVTIEPGQAQITVSVQQREDARQVAVNTVTTGTPPDGYWLSAVQVAPVAVTLVGETELLDTLPGFVDTLPVDVSNVFGTLETNVPLNVPAGVQVLDETGTAVAQVTVSIQVEALQGDLSLTRSIEIVNGEGMTITLSTDSVDLLLSGDLPTLREIETDSSLVRVTIDAAALPVGQSENVVPAVILPEDITYQLVNSFVVVTKEDAAAD
jgi:diadenylate cyclase